MQMLSVSKKKFSNSMLSSLNNRTNSKSTQLFEKETTNKILNNEAIRKTMELLSKV